MVRCRARLRLKIGEVARQSEKQVELKATMQNQIAASGLTTKQIVDEIQPQTPLVGRRVETNEEEIARLRTEGRSEEAIALHMKLKTDQSTWKTPDEEKGLTDTALWMPPKDTEGKSDNSDFLMGAMTGGFAGGSFKDQVNKTNANSGVSTQKAGSPSSQASMPSTSTAAASLSASSGGSNMQANLASIFRSVIPKVSTQVTPGGNEVQLGTTVAAVGRIGSKTITT